MRIKIMESNAIEAKMKESFSEGGGKLTEEINP